MTRIYDNIEVRVRRGSTAEWEAANPVLGPGELGYDTDIKAFKVGDGVRYWTMLRYSGLGGPRGEPGPEGPPGPAAAPMVHTQATPAATWTIEHGLGRVPVSVEVVLGTEVVETDTNVDATHAVLTFATPVSGTALIF